MTVKLLTEHHLEFLSLKGGCTGTSESTLVKMSHCWKSHVTAHMLNQQPVTVSCVKPYVSHLKVKLHNEVPNSLQGSHRLEKYLNIEGFLEN